jgi:hypothetical protein
MAIIVTLQAVEVAPVLERGNILAQDMVGQVEDRFISENSCYVYLYV